jgi:hypothetical protein
MTLLTSMRNQPPLDLKLAHANLNIERHVKNKLSVSTASSLFCIISCLFCIFSMLDLHTRVDTTLVRFSTGTHLLLVILDDDSCSMNGLTSSQF